MLTILIFNKLEIVLLNYEFYYLLKLLLIHLMISKYQMLFTYTYSYNFDFTINFSTLKNFLVKI